MHTTFCPLPSRVASPRTPMVSNLASIGSSHTPADPPLRCQQAWDVTGPVGLCCSCMGQLLVALQFHWSQDKASLPWTSDRTYGYAIRTGGGGGGPSPDVVVLRILCIRRRTVGIRLGERSHDSTWTAEEVHVPGAWCASPPLDSPLPTLLRAVLDREGILRRSLS